MALLLIELDVGLLCSLVLSLNTDYLFNVVSVIHTTLAKSNGSSMDDVLLF